MSARPIYLDHHAATPMLPEVIDAMLPYFRDEFGNASSTTHVYGKAASDAVERARRSVADLIGASPAEIVFTSGATESDNLALRGIAEARRARGNHIITTVIEHEAVIEPCRSLEKQGFDVTWLPVDRHGIVDPDSVGSAIREGTVLVSVQTANNEIGTIEPIAEIVRIARARGVIVHTDAAQAAGRIPVDVGALGVDLLSASAHKMYGPKGIGCLFVRRGVVLAPQILGGGHEKRRRSGTLNVPAIVGFGKAAEIAKRDLTVEMSRLTALRDELWHRISDAIEGVELNGHPALRLPNNLNVAFRHVEGEALMLALRDVAALSSGSACASGALEGSYVIRALGHDEEYAHSTIRFGLGRVNTIEQIETVVEHLARAVARLRALSPWNASSGSAQEEPGAGKRRSA